MAAAPRPAPSVDVAAADGASAAIRRDLYRTLSGLFLAPPTSEALAALADPDAVRVLAALIGPDAEGPLASVAGIRFGPALRQEFFDLLAVPTARYVTPFESVYCDARDVAGATVERLLGGPSTAALCRAYARAGFQVALPELPDHVGCELAFLAELAGRACDAWTAGDDEAAREAERSETEFARAHPARWLPRLAARIALDERAVLYPAAAALAAAVVARGASGEAWS